MSIDARAPSRRLVFWFALVAGVPLVALGAAGWRVLQQEGDLENRRAQEQLQNAATILAREIDRSLSSWESLLAGATAGQDVDVPAHSALVVVDADGRVTRQGVPLPYYPRVSPPPDVADLFAAAEIQEYQVRDLTRAAAAYRSIANDRTDSPVVRAAALVRLARVLRTAQRAREALTVYDELATLGNTPVASAVAGLVARRERAAILRALRDEPGAARDTSLLASMLDDGRFPIDHVTFDLYRSAVPGEPASPEAARLKLATAVEEFWPGVGAQTSGRSVSTDSSDTFVAVWRNTGGTVAMLVGTADSLLQSFPTVVASLGVNVTIENDQGRTVWGSTPSPSTMTAKSLSDARLPWTMRLATDVATADRAVAFRRNLFIAGFALMSLVVAIAVFFVFRAVRRELGVARLQSDFISAVSHEFRTPLTAMRHLTEVLDDGEAAADRVPQYHSVLRKETARLHAMVESLLDFGRMESGRGVSTFTDVDLGSLTARFVCEFQERIGASGPIVRFIPAHQPLPVNVDTDAMALALKNLLDNAVKYSANPEPVTVTVGKRGGSGFVTVADHGIGIGHDERQDVFRKFVRGTAARTLNVKGTGIGLAMAAQVVAAHRGRIELHSEVGVGSQFTILLPLSQIPAPTESVASNRATQSAASVEQPATSKS